MLPAIKISALLILLVYPVVGRDEEQFLVTSVTCTYNTLRQTFSRVEIEKKYNAAKTVKHPVAKSELESMDQALEPATCNRTANTKASFKHLEEFYLHLDRPSRGKGYEEERQCRFCEVYCIFCWAD
ncbi:hypothetical protein BCR37DRAFT_203031 [Protomyces lactucae-debilis]|uniref:Uncharacterized protein n=1 Tax=Protomyces lactucae-debilis TaxID=2754530 RepID=A0A1Y2ESR4_PROLT|nr:uncharacterized protein BCR37DRAFT_203031 [Protomyces lactucae-debilis]ORY74619.1 hypothetical protein BCR37DRAFT_203031 [Protomyces lactucae-debilis]